MICSYAQVKIGGRLKRCVHGNPRAGNIFVRDSALSGGTATDADFNCVNFDWAGHSRVARYPALLDNDIADLLPVPFIMSGDWPPGVVPCGVITPALDEEVMTVDILTQMGQGPRFCLSD